MTTMEYLRNFRFELKPGSHVTKHNVVTGDVCELETEEVLIYLGSELMAPYEGRWLTFYTFEFAPATKGSLKPVVKEWIEVTIQRDEAKIIDDWQCIVVHHVCPSCKGQGRHHTYDPCGYCNSKGYTTLADTSRATQDIAALQKLADKKDHENELDELDRPQPGDPWHRPKLKAQLETEAAFQARLQARLQAVLKHHASDL